MKGIYFEEHGDVDVLKYGELPDPRCDDPNSALVRVEYCALNHLDIWVRRGWKGLNLSFPHITGSDIVGKVVRCGDGSTEMVGRDVLINPGINLKEDKWTRIGEDSVSPHYIIIGEQVNGGMAEFVVVPKKNLLPLPESVDKVQACATALVGLTAWRMLFKRGRLRAGEVVLIVGAGGGVNNISALVAKKLGCTVIVLAGGVDKAKKAKELNMDWVINYKEVPDWHKEVLKITDGYGADLVVDNVGKATIEKSIKACARGGRIVTVGNTSGYQIALDNRLVFGKQISLIGSTMGSRQDFEDAMNYYWKNDIYPCIDMVEPIENGIDMIRYLEEGRQFGKIVLKVG